MTESQAQPPTEDTSNSSNQDVRITIFSRVTKESIHNYINNAGSFKRGKDLVPTLSLLNSKTEGDHMLLSGRAKGTSQEPYSLRITIRATDSDLGKGDGEG